MKFSMSESEKKVGYCAVLLSSLFLKIYVTKYYFPTSLLYNWQYLVKVFVSGLTSYVLPSAYTSMSAGLLSVVVAGVVFFLITLLVAVKYCLNHRKCKQML